MLNASQQKVFEFLQKRINDSIPPTVREICEETGLKSTSSVHAILKKLEDMGLIERDKNNSRSIRIAGTEPALQIPVLGAVQAGMPTLAVQ
ncbi:MAG: MarR family transcriptional regulator, partial [Clostridia bacterium]|nr:MarR family transcriptional regulator [Clostridia bacterium]